MNKIEHNSQQIAVSCSDLKLIEQIIGQQEINCPDLLSQYSIVIIAAIGVLGYQCYKVAQCYLERAAQK